MLKQSKLCNQPTSKCAALKYIINTRRYGVGTYTRNGMDWERHESALTASLYFLFEACELVSICFMFFSVKIVQQ